MTNNESFLLLSSRPEYVSSCRQDQESAFGSHLAIGTRKPIGICLAVPLLILQCNQSTKEGGSCLKDIINPA